MNILVTAAGAAASSIALPSPSQAAESTPAALAEPRPMAPVSVEVATPAAAVREGSFPEYPLEIFGWLPDGFVLEEQQIEMLCFWHRKAIEVIDQFLDGAPYNAATDEKLDDYCQIKNRILWAILSAPVSMARQVAAKLRAVVHEMECLKTDCVEEVLNREDMVKMSADLTMATAPIVPKKRVGALQRGRKLTRAGLLTRYQSFLVQELETVSWNLYGQRDYAKQIVFFDDEVRARCFSTDRCYPFFDERGLTTRARSVLKSLKIDTETSQQRS